jgi:hypothetical protein
MVPHQFSVNHSSRFALTEAIVDHNTLNIDHIGEQAFDWSRHNGHYYTNKAPGLSLLATLPYLFAKKLYTALGQSLSRYDAVVFVNYFVSVIPLVLTGFLIYQFTGQLTLAAIYMFGTIGFPFSAMPWGHPLAAFFLLACHWFCKNNNWLMTGLLFGLAVLTEYSAALYLFVLPLFMADLKPNYKKSITRFTLGGLIPAVLFFYYHWVCFGSPLTLASESQNADLNSLGRGALFGVLNTPSLKVAYDLLLSFTRGLLIICPVLALSFATFRKRPITNDNKAFLVIFLLFLLFNSSYNGWHGGWASGPRYLIPAIPFLVLLLSQAKKNHVFVLLALASIINNVAILAVNTMAIPGYNLLFGEIYPNLTKENHIVYFLQISTITVTLFFISVIYDRRKNTIH